MSEKRVLAIDFGASSGRAIVGSFDGEKITLNEVHRFSNDPVRVGGTVYWDVLRLFHEIKQGIVKAKQLGSFDSIGIDTWGVDFGLIDEFGCLLENPVHYRDERTKGLIEECAAIVPNDEFYRTTAFSSWSLTPFISSMRSKNTARISLKGRIGCSLCPTFSAICSRAI